MEDQTQPQETAIEPTPELHIADRFIDPTKILSVDIDSVRPNSWNPKDKDTKEFANVLASIKRHGMMNFIPVRENNGYEIIDGEQRWRACKELGYTKMLIYNEGAVDDLRAKELTVWWQVQVPWNDLSLAKMITDMLEQYESIAVPFDEAELERMKKLAKFDFEQYSKDNMLTPPPTADLLQNFMVQVTKDQFEVIRQALNKAIKDSGKEILDSEALEFVCASYLATPELPQEATA